MQRAGIAIASSPKKGGARFTEIMEGFLYIGDDIEDFEIAADAARGASSAARFYLSVDAWDIDTLIHKDNHAAMLTGTFSCGALSRDPFMVLRGDFQLFSDDSGTPDTKNLVYDFHMVSVRSHYSLTDFRPWVKLFASMDTRLSTLPSVSRFVKHGKPQRHCTLHFLVRIIRSLAAACYGSAKRISRMNCLPSKASEDIYKHGYGVKLNSSLTLRNVSQLLSSLP